MLQVVTVRDLMAAAAAAPAVEAAATMEDPVITLLAEAAAAEYFPVLVVPVKLIQDLVPAVLVVRAEVPAVTDLVLLQQAAEAAGVHLAAQAAAILAALVEQP